MSLLPSDYALHPKSPIVNKTKEIISKTWNFSKTIHHNPSPKPVSLERKSISYLKDHMNDYVAAEKSDGVRYLLVLGVCHGKGFAVMVDMKMQVYQISLYANPEYFIEGTVFDGELVLEKITELKETRQLFLIFDAYLYKGNILTKLPFLERYKVIHKSFDIINKDILDDDILNWEKIAFNESKNNGKIVSLGNHKALFFKPKPFNTLSELGGLWRSMSRMKHESDGIIFTPISSEVGHGTHYRIFKWKSNHTVDLLVKSKYSKGTWDYNLFYESDTGLKPIISMDLVFKMNDIMQATSEFYAKKNKNAFSLIGEFKLTFSPESKNILCSVEKWRKDKPSPNYETVIKKTIDCAKENIKIDELINFFVLQSFNLNKQIHSS